VLEIQKNGCSLQSGVRARYKLKEAKNNTGMTIKKGERTNKAGRELFSGRQENSQASIGEMGQVPLGLRNM
jgi:hypothetical protein